MGLKAYVGLTDVVDLPGGDTITVRGLALEDITTLVNRYGGPVQALFTKYSGATDIALDDLGQIGGNILTSAPELAGLIIALGADEPDAQPNAMKLPFPVQIDALEKIGKLTFDTAGGPKKVVETVIRVLRGATDLMVDMRVSQAGSLASGGK